MSKNKNTLRLKIVAVLPWSRVLNGFQLVEYSFSCVSDKGKVGSFLILIGISYQTLGAK